MANLFQYTSGPREARVILVGEAWGADEARAQKPFVGQAGSELDSMLFEAGIRRSEVLCTNVVHKRPNFQNDFSSGFTGKGRKGSESYTLWNGVPCGPELLAGLRELDALIELVKPDLVIGCGNWPLWALTDHASLSTVKGYRQPAGITKWRGSQTWTHEINGKRYPYLPIIHPAAILRQYPYKYPTVHDLKARARRFLDGDLKWEIEPKLRVQHKPTFEQALSYLLRLKQLLDVSNQLITCDVETHSRRHLACIGLCHDDLGAICIPFFHFASTGPHGYGDYWTLDQEVAITKLCRNVLTHSNLILSNQNILYDLQFLERRFMVKLDPKFDTMVAHHLLWPGTPKGLHYLASLYCDQYCYWKDESEEWDLKMGHEEMWLYNCKDTMATLEITHILRDQIEKTNFQELFQERLEQVRICFDLALDGINYDVELQRKYKKDVLALEEEIGSWLLDAMPFNIQYTSTGIPWYNSPIFQQKIFYEQLGLEPVKHKKTKRPTMDKEALEVLRKKYPYLWKLFDQLDLMRSLQTFRSHFLDINLRLDNRYVANFNPCGTETFRWSSSANPFGEGTNTQNLPKIEED